MKQVDDQKLNSPLYDKPEIRMSDQWTREYGYMRGGTLIGGLSCDVVNYVVLARSRIQERGIREQIKIRRTSLILAAGYFIVGCLVIVFSPEGQEQISNWVGVAMLILSGVAAGYKKVWGQTLKLSMSPDHVDNPESGH